MLKTVDFYYFSPTGGTKKAGEALACGLAEAVNAVSLAEKEIRNPESDVVVVAAPVFGGRIPAIVTDKLAKISGKGKKAVTAVVYGVRAYEDALLELNDAMISSGFEIIASAALVAQHSIVPVVGAGRPDQADLEEIRRFAGRVLQAMEEGGAAAVSVPGNRPYKTRSKSSASPITLADCVRCGECAAVCPTEAIAAAGDGMVTDAEKCIMCMACTAKCPTKSRVLPAALQAGLTEKLSVFRDVRRENEFFIS